MELNSKLLERQYTALSLLQHIQAKNFMRQFKPNKQSVEHVQLNICFKHDPQVNNLLEKASKSLTVDHSSFTAYFTNQLFPNERLLLSAQENSNNNAVKNQHNHGLPNPTQLQHVFDVLSTTVTLI